VKLKVGNSSFDMGPLSCHEISMRHVGGTSFWLSVIDCDCPGLELLLARFQTLYTGYGTWSIDPATGYLASNGDISGFAEMVDGVTYHLHCNCYLKLNNDEPDLAGLVNYLNMNYPSYGAWMIDPDHADSVICTGDICSFILDGNTLPPPYNTPAPEIKTSDSCKVVIDSYDCTDQDVVDWLNLHKASFGEWSLDGDMIVCDGDISAFDADIPCIEYALDNDGDPEYTDLMYGTLGTDSFPISHYIQPGACFHFSITLDAVEYVTNCFYYETDTCLNTRIRYRSNADVFGFDYTSVPSFYNTVRLPLYIRYPEIKTSETVYRTSDGSNVLLSATMEEIWEALTNYLNGDTHKKLQIALENNDFQMFDDENEVWTGYRKEGDYAIDWQRGPGILLDAAPASFKLKTTPFYNVNSNCQ
jgi:hypothetical protein